MALADKADSAKDKAVGRGKEEVGAATDNKDMQAEGEGQQAGGKVKEGVENLKDKLR